jgi:hypothetical protein
MFHDMFVYWSGPRRVLASFEFGRLQGGPFEIHGMYKCTKNETCAMFHDMFVRNTSFISPDLDGMCSLKRRVLFFDTFVWSN